MEPPGIPQEDLRKAQLVRAELLFKTNKLDIIQEIKDNHNMNLEMTLILTRSQCFKIKIRLIHCETTDTLNTVRYVFPTPDILYDIRQLLREEVTALHHQMDVIASGIVSTCWYCGEEGGHTE